MWTDACVEGELRVQTLHLFSGPDDREDGIAAFLHVDGIGMDCIDLINETIAPTVRGRYREISNLRVRSGCASATAVQPASATAVRLRRTDPHRVNIWLKIEGLKIQVFVGGYSAPTLTVVDIWALHVHA